MKPLMRWILTAALCASAPAMAQAPALIPVQGFATDDEGAPLDGEIVVDFTLYTSAVDGDALYTESQVLDADVGFFSTMLGLGDALDLGTFAANGEVWVEIEIDGEVLEPRLQFGTVPYAAWADSAGDAQTVGGATLEDLQAPVAWGDLVDVPADLLDGDDDTTDWASLTGVPEDLLDGDDDTTDWDSLTGVPADLLDGDDDTTDWDSLTGVPADLLDGDDDTTDWASLTGVPADLLDGDDEADLTGYQRALTGDGGCPAGSSLRTIAVDGSFTCQPDTDTTYTAGDGLLLVGGGFVVDLSEVQARLTAACPAGRVLQGIEADGTPTCVADADTTYTAGSGLTLSGGTFSVNTAAIQARVTGTCPAGASIRSIAADGTVTCESDDTGATYAAGAGLDLTGTTFSIPDGAINSARLANDAVGNAAMQNNAIGSAEIIDGSITAADIGANAVGTSEITNGSIAATDLSAATVDSLTETLSCTTVTTTQTHTASFSMSSTCAAGYQLTGGGHNWTSGTTDVWFWQSAPTSNTRYTCRGTVNRGGSSSSITCYARCCRTQ